MSSDSQEMFSHSLNHLMTPQIYTGPLRQSPDPQTGNQWPKSPVQCLPVSPQLITDLQLSSKQGVSAPTLSSSVTLSRAASSNSPGGYFPVKNTRRKTQLCLPWVNYTCAVFMLWLTSDVKSFSTQNRCVSVPQQSISQTLSSHCKYAAQLLCRVYNSPIALSGAVIFRGIWCSGMPVSFSDLHKWAASWLDPAQGFSSSGLAEQHVAPIQMLN